MRYIVQGLVMAGDLMLLAAIIAGILIPAELPVKALILVIAALAFNAWKQEGGFMAWKKPDIKIF
jgi:hypothetical protein